MKHLSFILSCLLVTSAASAQNQGCIIDLFTSSSSTQVDCEDTITFTAAGYGQGLVIELFGPTGPLDTNWQTTSQAIYSNPCGPGPSGAANDPHLWMGDLASVPRSLTTNGLNTSQGALICFDLRMAIQSEAAPCEGPDLPDEGVFLQYSTDNGNTWVTIDYFNPDTNGCGGQAGCGFTSWGNYCFTLPPAAWTTNTQIRWIQTSDSGSGFDHWGLDNIQITGNDSTYFYYWDDPLVGDTNTRVMIPTIDSTIVVYYTNGLSDTCSDTVSYTMNPTDAGPPVIAACDPTGPGEMLMGSGAVNVVWTPNQDIINANTLTPTVFPANDIYYTMTSACGEDSVLVDVVPAINLAPIADDTICLFGTTTLTAVPSPSSIPIGNVQWTPATGLNDATSLSVVASPASTTTYVVEVTSTDGCNVFDTVEIVVSGSQPIINSSNDTTLCAGDSLNLFTEVLPPASGQYVVTPIPYAPVSCTSPTTLSLSDDQVSAAIPIGFPFLFYGNTYTDIYVSSNGFVTFNPGSASGCCTGEDLYVDNSLFDPTNLIALAWNDLNPNSGGTISYCIEGSAPNRRFIIDYSGVSHFGGGLGVTGQIILYEGTGVIDIISSDIINDGGNMTQGIQNNTLVDPVDGAPVPNRNASDWSASNDAWSFIPYVQANVYEYLWTPATGLDDPTSPTPVFTGNVSTQYVVSVTPAGTTCSATDTIDVNVVPGFTYTLSQSDDTVCRNQAVNLEVNASGGSTYTYTWTPDGDLDVNNAASVVANPTSNGTNTYNVLITAANNCAIQDSFEVFVAGEAPSRIEFDGYPFICQGDSVEITATPCVGVTLSDNFDGGFDPSIWANVTSYDLNGDCGSVSGDALHFDGGTSAGTDRVAETLPIDASSGGSIDFWLIMGSSSTSGSGCENADAGENVALQYSIDGGLTWIDIAVYDEALWETNPAFQFFSEPIPAAAQTSSTQFRFSQIQFSACTNCDEWAIDDVTISAGCCGPACGVFEYSWSPSTGLSDPTIANPIVSASTPTTYTVTVTPIGTTCSSQEDLFVNVGADFNYTLSQSEDTICLNNTVQFNVVADIAAGPYTFTWGGTGELDADSIANPSSTPSVSDSTYIYTLEITSANGCRNYDTTSVVVNGAAPPSISFFTGTNSTVYCGGAPLLLTTQVIDTFGFLEDWESGSIDPAIWGNTLNVIIDGFNGVSNALHATQGASGTARFLETVPLDLSNGGSLEFDFYAGYQNAYESTEVPVLQYSIDGGLTWIEIDNYSIATGATNFTQFFTYPIPAGAQTPNTIIRWFQPSHSTGINDDWGLDNISIETGCSGAGCGNFDVAWSAQTQPFSFFPILGDTTYVSPGNQVNTSAPNGPAAGDWYIATVTASGTSCSTSDSIFIYYGPSSQSLTPDTAICLGDSLTLTATGGLLYNWTNAPESNAPVGITGQNFIDVFPTTTTTYVVNIDSLNCPPGGIDLSTTIRVVDIQVVEPADTQTCSSSPVELSYTELAGPYEYSWTPANLFNASPGMGMTSTEVVSPVFDITLNVEISGPGGICAEQFDIFVDVIEQQIVPITTDNPIICNSSSAVISAPSGYTFYSWNTGVSGVDSDSITINAGGPYFGTVTTLDGCDWPTDTIVIQQINSEQDLLPDTTYICEEATSFNLIAPLNPNGEQFTYQWLDGGPASNVWNGLTATGVYTVRISSDICTGEDSTLVYRLTTPTIDFSSQLAYLCCDGELILEPTITEVAPNTVGVYLWSNGEDASTTTVDNDGDYVLTLFDAFGCASVSDTFMVTRICNDVDLIVAMDSVFINELSDSIQAIVTTEPSALPTSYESNWTVDDFNAMLINSDDFITGLSSEVAGTYTVFYDVTSSTITPTGDTVVCVEQTRSANIVVRDIIQLLLPDAFTPNGDGLNDIFAPSNPSLDIVSLDIFNRWGEQVYSYDGSGWDGRWNNQDQQPGTYMYYLQIRYANGEIENITGTLSLIR